MMTETKDVNVYTGSGGMGGFGGYGFGGDGYWLIILFLIFAFAGNWGGNGGFGGAGGGYVSDNYALITDNATLERKIDGVYSGICDSTYALNNAITGGFAAAQSTMTQGFAGLNTGIVTQGYETRNAITQDTIANMQGFNGLQAAVKDCCCTTQQNTKDTQYIIATQANGITNAVNNGFCTTNFNAQTNTRDIIDSQNANTRAILDAINANKVEALKDRISEQNQTITALNLAASQAAQNEHLINTLRPCPIPAYQTCNPWASNGTAYNCGCA